MQSWRFDTLDGLRDFSLHEEPMPRPQRGEVLLRVLAVSLNYRDIAIPMRTYPQPTRPGLIPCSDAACEVVEVGDGVSELTPGDRVVGLFHPRWFGGAMPATAMMESYGSGQDGWLTKYKVVSQEAVLPLPEAFTPEEGSTLPCAATTAWTSLTGAAPIRPGATVLTQGTGGVSLFAVQLGVLLGARVIATTSSDAKAQTLIGLGADTVVNYAETPEWGERVRALTGGKGVDRVVEVGGPSTINQSLKAVGVDGEIALIGFLGSSGDGIDFFDLHRSAASVRVVKVGNRAALAETLRATASAGLKPVIDRVFAFEDAKAAFEHLHAGRHVGKIVVRVSDGPSPAVAGRPTSSAR